MPDSDGPVVEHLLGFIGQDGVLYIPTAMLRFVRTLTGQKVLQQAYRSAADPTQFVWQNVPLVDDAPQEKPPAS